MMIERFLFSIILLLSFVAAVKVFTVYQQRQIRRRSQRKRLPSKIRFDKPTLLYFWTPECSQCRPQEQQIERANSTLQQFGKQLNMQKFNAHEEKKLARFLGVMTVPTTVLIDSHGKVSALNPGLTKARKIVDQLILLN
jgi:thiol-disulfide isomerase/thioredoxin